MTARSSLVLALFAVACSGPSDPCGAAAAHVQDCSGIETAASATCDGAAAEQALAMSCDEISAVAASGKADGILCFFSKSYCEAKPAPAPVTPKQDEVFVTVKLTDIPASHKDFAVRVSDAIQAYECDRLRITGVDLTSGSLAMTHIESELRTAQLGRGLRIEIIEGENRVSQGLPYCSGYAPGTQTTIIDWMSPVLSGYPNGKNESGGTGYNVVVTCDATTRTCS